MSAADRLVNSCLQNSPVGVASAAPHQLSAATQAKHPLRWSLSTVNFEAFVCFTDGGVLLVFLSTMTSTGHGGWWPWLDGVRLLSSGYFKPTGLRRG